MAFYKLLFDNCSDERLEELGLSRDIAITHWAWYYPKSNHMYVEDAKKASTTAVLRGIATLIHAYERNLFPTKYSSRTCPSCSYYAICDTANEDGWL